MGQSYPRAPITEAVLQFMFADQVDPAAMAKAQGQLVRSFPKSENLNEYSIRIEEGGAVPTAPILAGYKLTSADGTQVVQLHKNSFTASQLAPYPGWDLFEDMCHRNYRIWTRATGSKRLSRISTRFINRIDVPAKLGEPIEEQTYLNISSTALPFEHGALTALYENFAAPIDGGRHRMVLNIALIPSPLIGHIALMVDIDVLAEVDLPRKATDIWLRVAELRGWKNAIFEALVTDAARELFQ
jgi:uncharacterized protein (TIGR04255 family)